MANKTTLTEEKKLEALIRVHEIAKEYNISVETVLDHFFADGDEEDKNDTVVIKPKKLHWRGLNSRNRGVWRADWKQCHLLFIQLE